MINAYTIAANNPSATGGGGTAPVASFTVEPEGGGTTYHQYAPILMISTSTGESISHDWKIDGVSRSSSPAWVTGITSTGNHTISLTVSNPFGSDTDSTQIYVQA